MADYNSLSPAEQLSLAQQHVGMRPNDAEIFRSQSRVNPQLAETLMQYFGKTMPQGNLNVPGATPPIVDASRLAPPPVPSAPQPSQTQAVPPSLRNQALQQLENKLALSNGAMPPENAQDDDDEGIMQMIANNPLKSFAAVAAAFYAAKYTKNRLLKNRTEANVPKNSAKKAAQQKGAADANATTDANAATDVNATTEATNSPPIDISSVLTTPKTKPVVKNRIPDLHEKGRVYDRTNEKIKPAPVAENRNKELHQIYKQTTPSDTEVIPAARDAQPVNRGEALREAYKKTEPVTPTRGVNVPTETLDLEKIRQRFIELDLSNPDDVAELETLVKQMEESNITEESAIKANRNETEEALQGTVDWEDVSPAAKGKNTVEDEIQIEHPDAVEANIEGVANSIEYEKPKLTKAQARKKAREDMAAKAKANAVDWDAKDVTQTKEEFEAAAAADANKKLLKVKVKDKAPSKADPLIYADYLRHQLQMLRNPPEKVKEASKKVKLSDAEETNPDKIRASAEKADKKIKAQKIKVTDTKPPIEIDAAQLKEKGTYFNAAVTANRKQRMEIYTIEIGGKWYIYNKNSRRQITDPETRRRIISGLKRDHGRTKSIRQMLENLGEVE